MLSYKYYDTPDGHDILKKWFVTSKYATITGIAYGTFDVLLYSHPKGILNTAGRYLYIVGPLVGMASAFTVTANISQNIRGKDDNLNYFLGGVAAGSVFGAWQRSAAYAGVPAALFLGAIAIVKKSAVDNGWTLLPEAKRGSKSITDVRNDWTLVKDLEGRKGWTTGAK